MQAENPLKYENERFFSRIRNDQRELFGTKFLLYQVENAA